MLLRTFLEEAHRHAQIIIAEEKDVDAVNGRYFLHVLDARGGLDLLSRDGCWFRAAWVRWSEKLVAKKVPDT